MTSIDIRGKQDHVTEIIFGERTNGYILAHKMNQKCPDFHNSMVEIHDDSCHVLIASKEHAENLIKALKKAITLGWLV